MAAIYGKRRSFLSSHLTRMSEQSWSTWSYLGIKSRPEWFLNTKRALARRGGCNLEYHLANTYTTNQQLDYLRRKFPNNNITYHIIWTNKYNNYPTCKASKICYLQLTSMEAWKASTMLHPLGCWSTAPRAVVLMPMMEHYYIVYLYMLCWFMYWHVLLIYTKQLPISGLWVHYV